MVLVGLVGLANKGKSTLFNALTEGNAEVANYPFTTIDPNKGVAFVAKPCPHTELGKPCAPRNSKCVGGTRFVPINVIDVAGLVPGAHEGKGRGNQFLSDLSQADALICVADASGGTDDEGKPVELGSHDPCRDVQFLEQEVDYWLAEVLHRNALKCRGKPDQFKQVLAGLRIPEEEFRHAVSGDYAQISLQQYLPIATELRRKTKPLVIAANKADLPGAAENIEKIKAKFPYPVVAVSADAELSLKRAVAKGWVKIIRANDRESFELTAQNLDPRVTSALDQIKKKTIDKYGSTGVQELLNLIVFDLLHAIVVYPVEDEKKWANHFGDVLPDAILLPKGSKALDLAEKIHSDLAKGFLHAIDGRTNMKVSRDYVLKDGDVLKIVSAR
ncbi:redox-regulated ATPase YchF [Candidatus Micrarchaeota archaeon]|nr:redox-regulated ATPase YchF [Candidatus Micrarchaeota archaeon]